MDFRAFPWGAACGRRKLSITTDKRVGRNDMKHLNKVALLCAGLALAACTNADRFDDTNTVDLNGAGAGGFAPGSAQDPNSPLYF